MLMMSPVSRVLVDEVLGSTVVLVPFDCCIVFEVEELDGVAAGKLKDDDELFDFATWRRVTDDDAIRD
eukprot:1828053-Rhodomonas_salina.1